MTFVVVEGGEGSGKSTQAKLLATRLRAGGREVVLTFEPGDTKMGVQMRELLLHGDVPIDARAELMLMLADRAQHVAEVIRPALDRGAIVVCDRYSPSTIAYQGAGRDLGFDEVAHVSDVAAGGLAPDVVVVLDVPDDVAEARVAQDRDRFERAGDAFHARVRAAYRELSARFGWVVVDGTGSVDDVAERLYAVVSPHVR